MSSAQAVKYAKLLRHALKCEKRFPLAHHSRQTMTAETNPGSPLLWRQAHTKTPAEKKKKQRSHVKYSPTDRQVDASRPPPRSLRSDCQLSVHGRLQSSFFWLIFFTGTSETCCIARWWSLLFRAKTTRKHRYRKSMPEGRYRRRRLVGSPFGLPGFHQTDSAVEDRDCLFAWTHVP